MVCEPGGSPSWGRLSFRECLTYFERSEWQTSREKHPPHVGRQARSRASQAPPPLSLAMDTPIISPVFLSQRAYHLGSSHVEAIHPYSARLLRRIMRAV